MQVTKVELKRQKRESNFKGWAKVTLDDILVISSVKFFEDIDEEGNPSYRILLPERLIPSSRGENEKTAIQVVNILSDDLRNSIVAEIIKEYQKPEQKRQRK